MFHYIHLVDCIELQICIDKTVFLHRMIRIFAVTSKIVEELILFILKF